jgi:LytR cell envelope-related transcriptional attenuator
MPATAQPASDFRGYRIEFSNGNGMAGLASRTARLVAVLGFEHPRLTNDKPFGRAASQLQYVAGAEAAAQAVNARLPVQVPLSEVARLDRNAKVRVLLGSDFPAPAPITTASGPVREAAAPQP